MRTIKALAAFAILAGLCAAPAAFAQTQARSVPVRIVDFDYAPNDMTIDVDTTVVFTNTGARPHTVTDRGGTFDTNPIAPKGTGSVTFTVPGRYFYFCRINPSRMNGFITVTGVGTAKATRVQALDPARTGESFRFDPNNLNVETGTSIVFANVGGKPHTLTADDGSFDTGVVTPGAEGGRFAGSNATITLTKPGTFPFHCEVHPALMKGVITVTGQEKAAVTGASGAASTASVDVVDFAFKPSQVSVAPAGEVTWRNKGSAPHTATFDDVQLDTGTLKPGTEGKLTAPTKPGSYSYHCNIHPAKMRGVLVVVGQNQADPTKVAAQYPPQASGGGPGGRVSALALATGVAAAFLGGFGISAFVRNGMGAQPPRSQQETLVR